MYKPITYNTNLLTEETDSFVNKLDPSKVFKSKNKTIIPKKKGPVQPAGGQKGPSGSASTSKSSSGSGNPVRKWATPSASPPAPQRWCPCTDALGMAQPQSLCVEPQSSFLLHLISAKRLRGDSSPHLNDRILGLLLPSAWARSWKGVLRSPQESFLHAHHSRLCHLLLLGAVRNVRFYVSD